jgi:hypothetical protein
MKRFFFLNLKRVIEKEEILQTTGIFFLFIALASTAAVMLAPLEIPKAQRGLYFASDPSGIHSLLIAIIIPVVLAPIIGACMTLWKLKWPSQD